MEAQKARARGQAFRARLFFWAGVKAYAEARIQALERPAEPVAPPGSRPRMTLVEVE